MTEESPTATMRLGKVQPEAGFTLQHGLVAGVLRREVKFFLRDSDVGKVRDILKTNCSRPSATYSGSRVTSIYFDDAGLGSYHDNLEGTGERIKVRLRWYDDREECFFFETKRRAYSKSIKERLEVESSMPLTSLDYRTIVNRLRDRLPESCRERLLARPDPVLITRYRRSYYVAADRRIRVTLDSELEWFDQRGRAKPHLRFGARLPRLAILELKTEREDDGSFGELLYPLRLRPTRSSKYAVGCQQLGLVSDSRGRFS
ncbi:MAG: polyphosphate polymerase domain-containing protein [Vicinamibacteria bacterium]